MPQINAPGPGTSEPGIPFQFTAIGTGWQIDTTDALPGRLRSEILGLAEDFDRTWSRFRADSLVAEVAHAPGSLTRRAGDGRVPRP
ncbi:hypothetical protein KNN17_10825 [Arthrobacter bambusae]|uniref:hypothetical protein n=1 Tax=Arthrobacter bambusae TaxID=1338426 RepID=UPI001F5131BA|nr:hypothetical protein [Arthrobacter bambusae]MCI0142072.1 hypothetical protein [Arthrobacter bambusae]